MFCFGLIGDESSITERSNSTSYLAGKKSSNEASTPVTNENVLSNSFQDLFSTENNEQARDLIINNVRHGMHRSCSGALSECGSDDGVIKKSDPIVDSVTVNNDKTKRKATMLLAGPKFRHQTIEPETTFQLDSIFPISVIKNFFLNILIQSVSVKIRSLLVLLQ